MWARAEKQVLHFGRDDSLGVVGLAVSEVLREGVRGMCGQVGVRMRS